MKAGFATRMNVEALTNISNSDIKEHLESEGKVVLDCLEDALPDIGHEDVVDHLEGNGFTVFSSDTLGESIDKKIITDLCKDKKTLQMVIDVIEADGTRAVIYPSNGDYFGCWEKIFFEEKGMYCSITTPFFDDAVKCMTSNDVDYGSIFVWDSTTVNVGIHLGNIAAQFGIGLIADYVTKEDEGYVMLNEDNLNQIQSTLKDLKQSLHDCGILDR